MLNMRQVLLVEDSLADIALMKKALQRCDTPHSLHVVRDGVEAISFLRRHQPYEDAPKPDLILLDLNLPKKSGREVLQEIKEDIQLRVLPVIVLSTSNDTVDILECYKAHVNAYVTKSMGLDKFYQCVQTIDDFWFKQVSYPPNS